MPNFAQVHLMGHLGRDPEQKTLPSGDSLVTFSVATSRKRRDEEATTWWNCTLFGKRGETAARYLRKGDPVHVWGEPVLRPYTARDGSQKAALEVTVDGFTFLRGKDSDQSPQEPRGAPAAPRDRGQASSGAQAPAFDEDIPF